MRCLSIFAIACCAVAFGVGGSISSAALTIAKINESSSLPPLEIVLPRLYSGKFTSVSALEERFREKASKDFGTSLQQASKL
jgi:hypothetical protein